LLSPEEIEQMYLSHDDHAARAAAASEKNCENENENENENEVKQKPPLRDVRILEGMAASGLRAIRYARELKDVGCVVANDLDPSAIEAIKRNKEFNAKHSEEASSQMSKVICAGSDVRVLMMQHEKMFDAVDLDPYGTPSTLLDGAVQAVGDGGLLCVTATDMAVLCGNNGEVCWTKYGAYPLRAKYCHEQAVRVLLASINAAAGRYKRHIVPVLSVHIDFYVRCFVRVYSSAKDAKLAPTKVSYVFQCAGCDTFELQPVGRVVEKHGSIKHQVGHGPVVPQRCSHCGWGFHMGGPFWTEPVHDFEWVADIKKQVEENRSSYPGYDKIHALLTTVQEELPDCPLHYDIHSMSTTLKATPPPMALFRSAVINAGYRVSPAHCNPLAIKTDAPAETLWDILRCWVKEHPVKGQAAKTPGDEILKIEPKTVANWTRVTGAFTKAQREGVTRYPNNPSENWGPKARAGRLLMDGQHPGVEGEVGPQGTKRGAPPPAPKRRKREGDEGS
jgi:tRNA (guanine26-N2/guanine27-N2)-dimethyltransferase